ncbi:MAG: hypothetical protein ABII85_06320 [Bacillota bacterium]
MSSKKESKCSNNKKAVRSSLERATAVLKAFKRDHQMEMPVMHPGQLSCEGILFPTFDPEVQS